MKFLNFNKVLCLSPHPDDVEYSMSGLIMKYTDTHFEIINITNGRDITGIRKKEVDLFWKGIDNVNYSFLDYQVVLADTYDITSNIERIYNVMEYDAVFCTSNIDSHFEHINCNIIGNAICRKSLVSLIEYKSPSTLPNWIPNTFVDITDFVERKINRLESFKSQSSALYFRNDVLFNFHTEFLYSKRTTGTKFAEQFNLRGYYA